MTVILLFPLFFFCLCVMFLCLIHLLMSINIVFYNFIQTEFWDVWMIIRNSNPITVFWLFFLSLLTMFLGLKKTFSNFSFLLNLFALKLHYVVLVKAKIMWNKCFKI